MPAANNEDDWEDVGSDSSSKEETISSGGRMSIDIKKVIEVAENNNELLMALMSHPSMNRTNPGASPRPLFFAADFVRKTYLEYVLPLLPREAVYKSSKLANPYVIAYGPENGSQPRPVPTEGEDAWLLDERNWPADRSSKKYRELYQDAFSRTMMVPMGVNDPMRGALILGGQFDWERPVNIKAITQRIMNN